MVEIRQVERFEQDAMDVLLEPIFGDNARNQYMRELLGPTAAERSKALIDSLPKPERIRIAAFDDGQLVGCSAGWYQTFGAFYIGMSAVAPAYRKQGVYTRMLTMIEATVRERGCPLIESQHVATNNAVLIAKLKLGYVVAGTEYHEQMGLLVRLRLYLNAPSKALYASRTGTLVPPAA